MQETQEDSPAEAEQPDYPAKTLLGWLWFLPASLAFIFLLFFFEVLQLLALPFGSKIRFYSRVAVQYGFYHYLHLLGARYDIEVPFEVDKNKAYILVSNHQSMFDIPLIYVAFRTISPRYIAKQELKWKIPGISRYLRYDGSALIERQNPRQALPCIKDLALRASEEGFGITIFPEGTRARTGLLKKFRPSGLKILFQNAPDAEVVPVALDGTWKFTCYPKGPVPLGVRVSLRAAAPIDREGKSTEELIEECASAVGQMLQEIREAS